MGKKSNLSIVQDYLNGTRPFIKVGYTPKVKQRKEGETWTDNKGITWMQRKGYKTRVNKRVDEIREELRQVCSNCKKDIKWGDRLDKLFFPKTGKCYECVVNEETIMRINGTYNAYEKKKVMSNQLSFLKELKQKIEESVKYLSNTDNKLQFLNEDGTVETWADTKKDDLLETAKLDLQKTNEMIENVSKEIEKI